MPADLALVDQHVVGPLQRDRRQPVGDRAPATAYPASSGSHGHVAAPARRGAAAPRRSAPSGPASPTSGRAGRGRRSGARRPPPAPRAAPARARSATTALVEAVASTTSTRQPAARPRAGRRRVVGAVPDRTSWALHWRDVRQQEATRRECTAQPGEGTDVPAGHRHPHHGGQARRPRAAPRRGGPRRLGEGDREAARQGSQDRPRAHRAALRRGLVRRARRAGPAPLDGVRPGEEAALRRRRGHRLRHHRRPPGLRVLPGLHGLRRLAGRGLRREDHQGDGPRHQDRLPDHRHQRGRRRPHPGGRGLPRPVRRDLPPQRARLAASSRRSA